MTIVALPQGGTFRYWDLGSVGAGWSSPGFDDSGWSQGPSPLGYGDPHIVTFVSFGPNPNAKFITTWFRTTFVVKNAPSVISATLELLRDDGAVVYVNGSEWARTNMPNGAVSSNTLASSIIQGAEETQFLAFSVDPALLVEGVNSLAIEVHQAVENSSDLGIDAQITLEQFAP